MESDVKRNDQVNTTLGCSWKMSHVIKNQHTNTQRTYKHDANEMQTYAYQKRTSFH